MRISTSLLVAAVVSAGALSLTARGEDALDLGLGPKQGPPPAEVKKTDAPADEKPPKTEAKKEEPAAPVGGELISPEASKAVDDQDLVKKLTGEEKPGDKFKEVVTRMDESATRLKDKDTGNITQETQRRIVMDLDVLIEMAKKMQQSSSSSSQSQKPGQQKQESKGNQKGEHSQGGDTAAQKSVLPNGAATAAESNGSDINEKSKEWGGLPDRDRDLVSHGASEQFLPAYKDQIDKYYQALAEIGKAAKEK